MGVELLSYSNIKTTKQFCNSSFLDIIALSSKFFQVISSFFKSLLKNTRIFNLIIRGNSERCSEYVCGKEVGRRKKR